MPDESSAPLPDRPSRILVLRGLDGAGGGAEHIILNTAAAVDRQQFARCGICCMHAKETHSTTSTNGQPRKVWTTARSCTPARWIGLYSPN